MSSGRFRATWARLGWRRVSAQLAVLSVAVLTLAVLTSWSLRTMTLVVGRWVWPWVPNVFADPLGGLVWGGPAVLLLIPCCYVSAVLVPFWGIVGLLHLVYRWRGWTTPPPVVGTYY